MVIDRTEEFRLVVVQFTTPSDDALVVLGENDSLLRERRGKKIGFIEALFNRNKTISTHTEELEFAREFLNATQAIWQSLKDPETATTSKARELNLNKWRQELNDLEESVKETRDILLEQASEHYMIILLSLKQRLGHLEKTLIGKVGRSNAGRDSVNRKPNTNNNSNNQTHVAISEEELKNRFGLSTPQLQALQLSTKALLEQHSEFSTQLTHVGDRIQDISRMQDIVGEQIELQEALGGRLLDEAESTMGTVKKGNQLLERANQNAAMRNAVIIAFLCMALILLLFDWLN